MIGASLRGGVTARVAPGIRVGLNIETPTFYAIDEEFSTKLETFFDNGDVYDYGFRSDETAGAGEFDYEILTPWRAGAGLAFTADVFQVFADAEFVDWSQMTLDSDLYNFSSENQAIRQDYDPVVNARVGGEYYLGNLVLRGGFAFQPDPREGEARTAGGETLDRSKTYFSAGLGYRFADQFRVDLGWMQERFDDQFLPYTEVTDAPIVDEQVLRNRFALGVNILF
jgi:predicted porin